MYTLTGRRCGVVRFQENSTITKETVARTNQITENPVETGAALSDHVFQQPTTVQISGIVAGGQQAMNTLAAMAEQGDIVEYAGRTRISNVVIQNLSQTFGADNRRGFGFTATLKRIHIASAQSGSLMSSYVQADANLGASQTSKTRADGLHTTVSDAISGSAYSTYLDTYNKKPASSSGPYTRQTPSNSGRG